MDFLHLRTILFSSIFSISVCTLMIGMLWWMHRHRSRAFAFWIAGYILQCTGVFLIVVRSLIPYVVSVSAGVPLFLAGALLITAGVEYYVRDIPDARRWWFNCAWLSFFIAFHVWFALVRDNLPARTINYNLGLFFFYGQIVWFLSRETPQDIRGVTRMLGVVAGLFVVASVLRIIVELIFPAEGDYFLSGRLNSLFILVDQVLIIWFTFALFLTVNQHLLNDLARDIVERKRSEEELRKQKEFAENLFNTAPVIVLVLDASGCVLTFNPYMESLCGYKLEEVKGKDWFQTFLPDKVRARTRQLFDSAVYDIATKGNINPIIGKDGKEILVEWWDKTLKDAQGNIIGIVAVGLDITDREKVEDALREHEKQYRTLFEGMAQGAFYQRADGTIADVNHAALRMFGLSSDQFFGSTSLDPCWKVIHEDGSDFPGEQHPSMEALRTGKPVRDVVAGVLNPREGCYTWMEITAIPQFRAAEDKPYQVFVTLHDITERKRAEDALRKAKDEIEVWNRMLERRVNEKTEQLLRATKLATVGQLAASVAHELNNPLAGLLSMLGSYRKNVKNNSLEYEEVQAMCYAVEYMTKVVGDLGLFVRESGGVKAKEDLNEILESISSFCLNLMERWKIQIIKEYDAHLLPVMADRRRLQQVFLNMVTNARDAMPKGGTFTIRTGNTPDGKHVFVEFIDTGVGIKNEDLPRLFDPFFTTKDPGRGIGIGLSIAQTIVKEHDGVIRVESSVGRGSTFVITMPAAVP